VPLSGRDRRWAVAVPAVLLAVALGQMILARVADLSPWKGAGFGMFSTVDSVDARFVRETGRRGDEAVPLALPLALAEQAAPIRTLPARSRMAALAERVARGTWVQLSLADAMRRYQERRAQGIETPAQDRAVHELRETARVGSRPVTGSLEVARMLAAGESPERPEDVLALDAVEVAVWRYRFDPAGPALRAEPLASVRSSARPGGAR